MATPTITVYSKKNCIQCTQTARVLDGAGITYDTYKVDEQPEKLEYIKSRYPNIMQAPIVTIRTEHPERYLSLPGVSQHESDENEICFSGFIPDVLKVAISESSEQKRLPTQQMRHPCLPTGSRGAA